MYSPIARSVILRNQTIVAPLGNVFIYIAARSRLSPTNGGTVQRANKQGSEVKKKY